MRFGAVRSSLPGGTGSSATSRTSRPPRSCRPGSPPRNGFWYTYNDDSAEGYGRECVRRRWRAPQSPAVEWVPEAPPTAGRRLRAAGRARVARAVAECTIWGAGIGADINTPLDARRRCLLGPKVPLRPDAVHRRHVLGDGDAGSDTSAAHQASDDRRDGDRSRRKCASRAHQQVQRRLGRGVHLPSNGNWKQLTVRLSDPAFCRKAGARVYVESRRRHQHPDPVESTRRNLRFLDRRPLSHTLGRDEAASLAVGAPAGGCHGGRPGDGRAGQGKIAYDLR